MPITMVSYPDENRTADYQMFRDAVRRKQDYAIFIATQLATFISLVLTGDFLGQVSACSTHTAILSSAELHGCT